MFMLGITTWFGARSNKINNLATLFYTLQSFEDFKENLCREYEKKIAAEIWAKKCYMKIPLLVC